MHGLGGHVVIGVAVGQRDAAAVQEGPDAVFSLLAVHVRLVVRVGVEGDEPVTGALCPRAQIRVEHFLPGFAVHARRVGEYAIEIEETGSNLFG